MIRLLRFFMTLGFAGVLAGCGLPTAWAPVIAAGLGLGAAVVTLDTEMLKAENERRVTDEGFYEFSPGP